MKYSSPVYSEASGSIGDLTYGRNQFGPWVTDRIDPPYSGTSARNRALNAMVNCNGLWHNDMDEAQRQSWNAWSKDHHRTNSLGQRITLTGQQAFNAANVPRFMAATFGGSPTTTPQRDAPSLHAPVELTIDSVAVDSTSGQVTITIDNSSPWCIGGQNVMIVQIGFPRAPTRNFYRGPFRMYRIQRGGAVNPTGPTFNYAITPWTVIAGEASWWRFRVTLEDGRLSAPVIKRVIAT